MAQITLKTPARPCPDADIAPLLRCYAFKTCVSGERIEEAIGAVALPQLTSNTERYRVDAKWPQESGQSCFRYRPVVRELRPRSVVHVGQREHYVLTGQPVRVPLLEQVSDIAEQ